ncbi:hypothetical protein VTO42DRAFT_8565 [Malbranchea cinnamomea]
MASEFVGYTVIVTLKSPPNYQVRGVVADVVGQRLTLRDVTLLWNGQRVPLYHIEASGIEDLELPAQQDPKATAGHVDPGSNFPPIPRPQPQPPGPPQAVPPQVLPSSEKETHQPFVDPAILSFTRPSSSRQPLPGQTSSPVVSNPVNTSPVMIGDSAASESSRAARTVPIVSTTSAPISQVQSSNSASAATLTAPFSELTLNPGGKYSDSKENGQQQVTVPDGRKDTAPLAVPLNSAGKQSRKGGKNKSQREVGLQATGIPEGNEVEQPSSAAPKKKGPFAGKGWRQTAFVEPADEIASPSPKRGRGRHSRARRPRPLAEESGWATEDATDIQEMGDFDFESNLSKFDKRRVFDEIRNDDTIPEKERLIGLNRRARPGTNGGRNLHYTENVLDPTPPQTMAYISETDEEETDEDVTNDDRFDSGRNSSRTRSRTSMAPPSRKGGTIVGASVGSTQYSHIGRGSLASPRGASPRPRKGSATASPMTRSTSAITGSLQITTTNRTCPIVSPLQMLEIEQLAISELGLTEDIITENAGRGIAEAAVSLASELPAAARVFIFAGNHRTGSRAVAAARHFRNRGYRVTLCILGSDRENEFTDVFRKQVDIFKKAGGRVSRWEELSARLSTVDNTPGLVVDALFGVHIAFEDLRSDDQATAFEMISCANRSGTEILSVDIPSGLSANSGEAMPVQGTRLSINASYVVCLGAPKTGLVNALAAGEGESWQIAVADIGISQKAWKFGTKRRHGVDFGNKWVVPLRYLPPNA